MSEDIYAPIIKKIIDYKEQLKEHIASGNANDMSEYSRMVGEYRCLIKIHQDLLDIQKNYNND
jgi:hypothetical protein|tara:strand:- start:1277 stop:1465 length:189 start_codon:yes stop_codon:yes gene_type:complete